MTNSKYLTKFLAAVLAIATLFSMMSIAFAADTQPYNADSTVLSGTISYSAQQYSVTVSAPPNTSKISIDATLYKKQLLGYTEVDSMSASVNSRVLNKAKSCTIESGKTYKLSITSNVYVNGQWDTVEKDLIIKT